MPNKIILLFSLLLIPLAGVAQDKYTDYLQKRIAGRGNVVIHQDTELSDLVNGVVSIAVSAKDKVKKIIGEVEEQQEEEAPAVAPSGRHTTANGYRVQIVSLGSTAKDKAKAESMGRLFKNYFPGINVYVSFRSPHYVCLVGDYKTREEASEMLQQMRQTRQFGSASVVRSKINVYY